MPNTQLDIKILEGWLWEAACKIRGEVDAPIYKNYILPLIFIKRLSNVYDDEFENLTKEFGGSDVAKNVAQAEHSLVRSEILNLSHNERLEKVLHELLHLKYPHHGIMFKQMFGVYYNQLRVKE